MTNKIERLLGVNIDHVATLRQARGTQYPDPVQAALIAEKAGADGITVHLREDRRHIQDRDVCLLKEVLQIHLNLEMAATEAMVSFANKIRPQYCCLVPERREELTTEGGLDVVNQETRIRQVCQKLAQADIEVSLFINPDLKQIDAALRCGAPTIEIHTGHYTEAQDPAVQQQELERIKQAAEYAAKAGLIVNAGHGLHYQNVQAVAAIPQLHEFNIGHSIIAQAVFVGLAEAVREMKRLIVIG
jgi:pyridoxine 5-phosphate synthase